MQWYLVLLKGVGKIISDITSFIFVSDKPHKVDIIFLLGGSKPHAVSACFSRSRNFRLLRGLLRDHKE